MTRILPTDADGIAAAAEVLGRGGLVAFPTETVYGIACRVDDPAALQWLFTLKGRPRDRRVAWLVPDVQAARRLGLVFDRRAEQLATRFWPGPLTLVLPRAEPVGGGTAETLGVRVPDHRVAHALLARTGPLATTSANRSGEPDARTAQEVLAAFGDVPPGTGLDAVIDGGPTGGSPPSSVVDLSVTPALLLREAAIPRDRLEAVIGPLD